MVIFPIFRVDVSGERESLEISHSLCPTLSPVLFHAVPVLVVAFFFFWCMSKDMARKITPLKENEKGSIFFCLLLRDVRTSFVTCVCDHRKRTHSRPLSHIHYGGTAVAGKWSDEEEEEEDVDETTRIAKLREEKEALKERLSG